MQLNLDLDYINERLNGLPKRLEFLKQTISRYLHLGYCVDDGAVRAGRYRKYGHDHYHITMFAPAKPDWLVWKRSFDVPLDYLQVLSYLNGLRLFDISLFGFTPSMQEDPPRLDRSKNQCLDITTANETWIVEYRDRPPDSIYIGGRAYTYQENSGYFMNENGSVCSLLQSGRLVKEWSSIWELLPEEIEIEEAKLHHLDKR